MYTQTKWTHGILLSLSLICDIILVGSKMETWAWKGSWSFLIQDSIWVSFLTDAPGTREIHISDLHLFGRIITFSLHWQNLYVWKCMALSYITNPNTPNTEIPIWGILLSQIPLIIIISEHDRITEKKMTWKFGVHCGKSLWTGTVFFRGFSLFIPATLKGLLGVCIV